MLFQEIERSLSSGMMLNGRPTNARRRACRRLASMERLENRSVFAGEVWVEVDAAGVLRITGDGLANNVEIVQVSAEKLAVIGRSQTRINGQLDGILTLPRTTSDVIVAVQGGDDYLSIGSWEGPQFPQTVFPPIGLENGSSGGLNSNVRLTQRNNRHAT